MQRAAIARALINRPAVVLADEPTGNLDSAASTQILELFARLLSEGGHTIILVSHAPDAALYAKGVVHLKDGRVQA
jgi:putative ABC transport system ATP-binding protein